MAPRIFGILNVTPDSFSDGGKYLAPEAAIAQGCALLAGGAFALDIGGAASNPDAAPVPPDVEIARLEPVVAALAGEGVAVSIDSFSPAVQRWALARGVAYVNDILGFPDTSLYPALATSGAGLIVMHAVQERGRAERIDVPPSEIWPRLFSFFDARLSALTRAGVARERIILDPGMGFFLGTNPETSLTVLRELPRLKERYALPVLISVSRKSFVRSLAGVSVADSGPATLAAELFAAARGADFIRTHDAKALATALSVSRALSG